MFGGGWSLNARAAAGSIQREMRELHVPASYAFSATRVLAFLMIFCDSC